MYSRFPALDFWEQEYLDRQTVFRVNDNGLGPELLTQVFLERGWVEYDEEHHGEHGWHIWWRTTRFRTSEYAGLLPWQRINHFPSCSAITRKDALCRNFRKMRIVHGPNVYSFSPQAYNLPNDYTKFVSEYAKIRNQTSKKLSEVENTSRAAERSDERKRSQNVIQDEVSQSNKQQQKQPPLWICKPAESSRGRGIFIFQHLSELQYDCNAVVQQYISDPLLIGGYKFDIRVYVAVPSFNPFQVYIHEEGLVRFSTEKYDLDRPDNVFAHLTNTSINKFSPGYTTDKEEVGHGCKWTISQLRRYFLQNNINDVPLWHRVTNIIILTLLIQAPTAPKISNCFELYGFDVLVDAHLRPWLLEVNVGPALSSDCQADLLAKKSMLHDLFDMVFTEPADPAAGPTATDMKGMGGASAGGGVGGLGLGRDFTTLEDTLLEPAGAAGSRGGGAGWTNTGSGSLDGLTDRTVGSLSSPQRTSRTNVTGRSSGLSLNQGPRPSGNVHALGGNSASSSLSRPSNKRLPDSGDFSRGLNKRNNLSNNNSIESHRKGGARDHALARRRSFKTETDVNGRSGLSRNTPNFLLPPTDPMDRRCSDSSSGKTADYDISDFDAKINLDNIKFQSIGDQSVSNTNLPVMLDKALVASDNHTFSGEGKDLEFQGTGPCVQFTDGKTSNTSDSGLSSLSQSSGENYNVAASRTPNSNSQKTGNGHIEHLPELNRNGASRNLAGANNPAEDDIGHGSQHVGTELFQRLSELSATQRDEDELFTKNAATDEGADSPEDDADGGETRPVLVHGNMRRLGVRRMLVPSPDRGTSNGSSNNRHKNLNNNGGSKNSSCSSPVSAPLLQRKALGGSTSSLNTSVSLGKNSSTGTNNSSNNSTHNVSPRTVGHNSTRRQYPRQQLQQRQLAGFHAHPADEKQARLYAIPRNFSRTEAARFPHSYQHGRQRYTNSNNNHPVTPKMPSKKVGRFYLVFPFSEATHRMSQGKFDPKAVIKEVQKNLRENLKRCSTSLGQTEGEQSTGKTRTGQELGTHIWAPLKTGDSFDY